MCVRTERLQFETLTSVTKSLDPNPNLLQMLHLGFQKNIKRLAVLGKGDGATDDLRR